MVATIWTLARKYSTSEVDCYEFICVCADCTASKTIYTCTNLMIFFFLRGRATHYIDRALPINIYIFIIKTIGRIYNLVLVKKKKSQKKKVSKGQLPQELAFFRV